MEYNHCCRVVLTGGPGGGKTTAADLFRRELGSEVVIVPEAATLLYLGGFPRSTEIEVRKATQRAIYHVQRNLEDIQFINYKNRILLCDRGTIDGVAYWPNEQSGFFHHLGTTLQDEIARYDAVVFFESAAVGGMSIEGGNPIRTESSEEAITLNERLYKAWSQHPKFYLIKHEISFFRKISAGLDVLNEIVKMHHARVKIPR